MYSMPALGEVGSVLPHNRVAESRQLVVAFFEPAQPVQHATDFLASTISQGRARIADLS